MTEEIAFPPTIKDREIALKELELKAIEKFSGDRHQNTSLSSDERLLIGIAYHTLVSNRFSISKQYCKDNNIPWNDEEFRDQAISDFLNDYLDFGLPVDRQGRKEVVDVYKAYFMQNFDKQKEKEPIIT